PDLSLVRPSGGSLHCLIWSQWKRQTARAYCPLPLTRRGGIVIACECDRHREVAVFRHRLFQYEPPCRSRRTSYLHLWGGLTYGSASNSSSALFESYTARLHGTS